MSHWRCQRWLLAVLIYGAMINWRAGCRIMHCCGWCSRLLLRELVVTCKSSLQ
jgi:hypothetical protein